MLQYPAVAILTKEEIIQLVKEAYILGRIEAVEEIKNKESSINWSELPALLTMQQASKICCEHPTTLIKKCKDGTIKSSVQVSGNRQKHKIPKDILRKYIENKR
jgi:hypothetical protein